MADALNLDRFRRVPFTNVDRTLTRDAATEMALLQRNLGGGTTGPIAAETVVFVPVGGLDAADVQAALVELDTEKEAEGTAAFLLAAHVTDPDPHTQYALESSLSGFVPTTRTVNGHALNANVTVSAADVGLGSVTNDAQTKAAIVPNTAPSAGQLLVGNAGGTAYVPVSASGDVTVASTGAHTIANDAVTYAKMQNVSATARVLGRKTAGAGDPEELTLSDVLDLVGSAANGDILIRSGGAWTRLAVGTAGQVLGVSGGLPAWAASAAGPISELANVTLGANGTSLASGTFTAKNWLAIQIYLPGQGSSDTPSLQFNGDTGNNYRYHWTHINAGATALTAGLRATTTDRVKVGSANSVMPRNIRARVTNFSADTEKLVEFDGLVGSGAVGTSPQTQMGNGAWISAAATQITSVSLVSTFNMLAGTQLIVHGWN